LNPELKKPLLYNSHIHNRRSIRLKGYDYSQAGAYFLTICCGGMECRFGKIENGDMIVNKYGVIAYDEWVKLPDGFPNFELDVYQIMPNHMHGIIVLNESTVGAGLAPARNDDPPAQNDDAPARNRATARVAPTTSATVGDI